MEVRSRSSFSTKSIWMDLPTTIKMRVAVTGTPGTGKTSATKLLEQKYNVIHINQLVKEKNLSKGYDEERNSILVDLNAVERELPQNAIIESHISHLFDVDKVIVLRCHPRELKNRLKGKDEEEIIENAEAEAIDTILIEAMEKFDDVHEINTTNKTVEEVSKLIDKIIEGEKELKPGEIDWSNWLIGS